MNLESVSKRLAKWDASKTQLVSYSKEHRTIEIELLIELRRAVICCSGVASMKLSTSVQESRWRCYATGEFNSPRSAIVVDLVSSAIVICGSVSFHENASVKKGVIEVSATVLPEGNI